MNPPLYLGFDIGGSTVRCALFNHDFQRLQEGHSYLEPFTSPEGVISKMVHLFNGLGAPEVAAIGVGLAAQLNATQDCVENAPNLGWRDVPFKALLQEHLHTPIFFFNDLNAILAGEHFQGAARQSDNVLAVYVGTGIGSAFICDGELIFGATGVAGEIGHFKVEVGGRRCGCGQRGCVEAYVSGIHLANQLREASETVGKEVGVSVGDLSDSDLLAAADRAAVDATQAPTIADLWRRTTDMLAVTIASATTLLNPERLLLGGGVLENLNHYRELTIAKIPSLVVAVAAKPLTIHCSELGGNQVGTLGAALLAKKFLSKEG